MKIKFERYEKLAIVLVILYPFSIAGGLCWLLYNLQNWILDHSASDATYLLVTQFTYWFIVGLMVGFGIIALPIGITYRALLGKKGYDTYTAYTNEKHGFDGMAVYKPMSIFFGVCATITAFLFSDYRIEVYSDKIVVNEFWSIEDKEYRRDDVESIQFSQQYKNPKGRIIASHTYQILFKDQWVWQDCEPILGVYNKEGGTGKTEDAIKYFIHQLNIPVDTVALIKQQ